MLATVHIDSSAKRGLFGCWTVIQNSASRLMKYIALKRETNEWTFARALRKVFHLLFGLGTDYCRETMLVNLKGTLRNDKYGRYAEQRPSNATFRLTWSDFQWYYESNMR